MNHIFAIAFVALSLTLQASALKDIIVRQLVEAPADCSVKAQNGDTVWIEHRGLHGEQLVDQNPEGEPLKIALGKGRVLKGESSW